MVYTFPSQENKTCHKKTKPVRFKSIPKTIQDYLESWKEDIKTKMKGTKQVSNFLVCGLPCISINLNPSGAYSQIIEGSH
jgi:hypothetical protein